ncbi:MAG: formate dehydrogenase, partial [Desulfobacteraceae bacterium]
EQAKSLGFEENQEVIMENDQGRARVMLTLSGDVPPDVLWTPRQSLDLDDSPMNTLMSPIPQPIGNGARYNSTRVRLKPN